MAFKKMKTGPYKGLFKFEFGRAGKNYEAEYFNSIEEGQAWLDSKREGSPRQINYEKFGKNYRKSELKKASQFLYEENKISSPDYDKIPSAEKQIVREKLRLNKGIFKKRNMFTPLAKGKQEIIKKYFPDADFSKGKSGFSPKDKSYFKVNDFMRRGFKPAYAPLFKYEQQQLVKAFPDIEFDFSRPGKFGIPGSHPNYKAVSTHLDEPKPYRYPNEVKLRQPRGWTFAQMDRAGDNVYEPILEKPNKPFASDNRIKGFIEKSTGKKYTYANINTHPKYKEIEKIFGIAERSRTPLSNYPTMVKYLPKGFDSKKVWLNDVLQVIADKNGIEGINRAKRAIEIHHAEGVKKNIGNVQPLRRDLNVLAETISKSKNIDTRTGELIKNNIRLELGGKNYGIKPQNPEKYFSNLIKGASTAMQEPKFEKNFVKAITDSPYACKLILNKLVGGGTASCEAEVRRDPLGVAKKLEDVKPTSAALGKVRNAARSFLNFIGLGKNEGVKIFRGDRAGASGKMAKYIPGTSEVEFVPYSDKLRGRFFTTSKKVAEQFADDPSKIKSLTIPQKDFNIGTNLARRINVDQMADQLILPRSVINKLKDGTLKYDSPAFRNILRTLGKGKVFTATAAVGAGAGALVKAFRNDDPDTYLSNENQMKAMLVDTFEEDTLGKAGIGGELAAAGLAVPGSAAVYKARRLPFKDRAAMGPLRAALGPVGKAASGFATPLGMGLTTPLNVASQLREGDSLEDIATNPLNYLGPAFAGTLTKEATRGMNPQGLLARGLRLGMSPAGVRGISKFFGLPGLALSLGYEGYDQYKKYTEGRGFVYNLLNKDE
jgi:hypothetical protein